MPKGSHQTRDAALRYGREDWQLVHIINPKWADQRTLDDFFPLKSGRVGASSGKPAIERPQGDQRASRAGMSMEEGSDWETREPGETYRVYRSRDVLGVLPEEMELVISYGARWIGVDEETLLRVTERYERRLSTWVGRQTRQEGIEGRRRSS
jgi:RNA polymerase I-specific transcription initiation factor RRN7